MRAGQSLESCLLLAALTFLLVGYSAGEITSACFGQSNKTLSINCGSGYMVHITRSFYGYSPTGQCRLTAEEQSSECTVDEHVHYNCVGEPSCQINLPTGHYGVNVPACGQRSNYFQVEYTCVPASSVSDICQTKTLTAQSGFIMTPRYPANYHQQGECSTTIHADPSQKLRLHIIDMNLEARTQLDCADLLYFNDKLRSITLCGERHNNSYNMHSNYLHIELQSNSGGKSKGFWLYYEAWPPLPTSMPRPVINNHQASGQQQYPNDWTHNGQGDQVTTERGQDSILVSTLKPNLQPKSTVPLFRNNTRSSQQLPFAAIAGGVIGTLSLILVILLLLLLIKWYKERRYNKVEKVLEIRNPAFRSSSDFHETQQQQNCYPQYNHHNQHHHHQQQQQQQQQHYPNNSGYYC